MKKLTVYKNNQSPARMKDAAWLSLSEESRAAYQYDYNLFFKYINKKVSDITPSDILNYIKILEKENYKSSSINRKIASLSKMFSVLKLAGEIEFNPIDELRKIKKIFRSTSREVLISLTISDIKKVIKIKGSDNIYWKRICMIIKILSITGMRISELINIKYSDISDYNKENVIIRIIGKGKKERFIYLSKEIIKEIEKTWPPVDNINYIFYSRNNKKYCRKYLWKQVHKRFIDVIKKDVHPHTLRHFFITHKISAEGKDIKAVSQYAGHSDVSITLQMYVDTALNASDSKIDI